MSEWQAAPETSPISGINGQLTINSERFSDMSSVEDHQRRALSPSPRTDLDLGKLDGHLQMDEGDLNRQLHL